MTSRLLAYVLGGMVVICSIPSFAQSQTPSQTAPSTSSQRGNSTARGSGRGQPCWQQLGLSQSVVQQHRQIEHNTKSQVQSVCNDSSLSSQQKQEKIRQLREQERKQIEALMTPQQEQELRACREQRRGGRGQQGGNGQNGQSGGRQARRGGGEGPCGQLQSGDRSAATQEPDSDQ